MPKQHLGNEVYATFDGQKLWLTQENGQRVLDMIVMDAGATAALTRFVLEIAKPVASVTIPK